MTLKIVFLGTSSGVPTKDRNLPSVFSCTTRTPAFRLRRGDAAPAHVPETQVHEIDRIFISHWHADHFAGLLGLVQTMCLEGRKKSLCVRSKRQQEVCWALLDVGYYYRDSRSLSGKWTKKQDRLRRLWDHAVQGRARIPALGYVFHEKDRFSANMEKAEKFGLTTSR